MSTNLRGFVPVFDDFVPHTPRFDPLGSTAEFLQKELTSQNLKSTQIIEEYHRMIYAHNGYLNAVFELAPGAMKRAEELDALRAAGTVLGPLHGIPILLKGNMNTESSMGLCTSGGTVALLDAEASSSATVVDKVQRAGMIVLGKSTMSEFGFFKGTGIRCGWSAAEGQSQSAYVFGGLDMNDSIVGHSSPSGSSSGSCIATSAGFAPVALGTETFGSLVNPATRASLYTIKPTRGIVPGDGILPISKVYDTAGPLGKTVKDVTDLLGVLVDSAKTNVPTKGYASAMGGQWKDIKIGTLDPETWNSPPVVIKPVAEATKQIVKETREAYNKLQSLVGAYHGNISQQSDGEFELEGRSAIEARLAFGLEADVTSYLSSLKSSRVRSLRELVEWNFENKDVALSKEYPNQDLLVSGLEDDHSPPKLDKIEHHLSEVGSKFEALFKEYDIDVIFAPADSGLYNFSAACGFPIATLPLSYLEFNGRPFGLTIAAPHHQEALLIKVMSLWESTFPTRQSPRAFLEGKNAASNH